MLHSGHDRPLLPFCTLSVAVLLVVLSLCAGCSGPTEPEDLFQAIETGNVRAVKRMAADRSLLFGLHPVRVGHRHEYKMTPLHAAAFWGQDEVLNALLAAGAVVDGRDGLGVTPLHVACGRLQLTSRRTKVSPVSKVEHGALPKASTAGLLLKAGASPNARDQFGITPLMDAAAKGSVDLVKLLIDAGADVNAISNNGSTILGESLHNWDIGVLEVLIQHGADLEGRNAQGATALMLAAHLGLDEAVERLLRAGANPLATDDAGYSAIDYAQGRPWPLKSGTEGSRAGIIAQVRRAQTARPPEVSPIELAQAFTGALAAGRPGEAFERYFDSRGALGRIFPDHVGGLALKEKENAESMLREILAATYERTIAGGPARFSGHVVEGELGKATLVSYTVQFGDGEPWVETIEVRRLPQGGLGLSDIELGRGLMMTEYLRNLHSASGLSPMEFLRGFHTAAQRGDGR